MLVASRLDAFPHTSPRATAPRGWKGHPSRSARRCPKSSAAMATRTFSTSKSNGKRRSRVRREIILGAIVTIVLFTVLSWTTSWPAGPRTKRRMREAMHNAYQWEEAHFHIGYSLQRPHALSKRPLRPDERDQVRAQSPRVPDVRRHGRRSPSHFDPKRPAETECSI